MDASGKAFFCFAILWIGGCQALLSRSTVRLVDNGYNGVVVGIDQRVVERENVISSIKRMFTEGSMFLHKATRKRVYFRNVTIIIPSNWTSKPEYASPGSQTFDTADIIIAPPNPLWAPAPYTLQVEGCGKPGSFIHFTDDFLTSPNSERVYGDFGRVLVHEWGHYRWGLFNEYPDEIGDAYYFKYHYFSMREKEWKNNTCPDESKFNIKEFEWGSNKKYRTTCDYTDMPGDDCIYSIKGAREATGSIMFAAKFPEIYNFCDNDTSDLNNLHNREAPNKHNRLCNMKSAWEVMREHDDFKFDNNPPVVLSPTQLMPTFTLVQFNTFDACRIVLVLDLSGSMKDFDRITKVNSAASVFIDTLPDSSWVGVVTFTRSAVIRHNLAQVGGDRESLYDTLNLVANGATCIGCGLVTGLSVLEQHHSGSVAGGIIILMSDGEDNGIANHPIRQTLQDRGVRVNSVLIGRSSDENLFSIAEETGGNAVFYPDDSNGNEIETSLSQTTEQCDGGDGSQDRIQVLSRTFSLLNGDEASDSVLLDSSIGRETQFISTYTAAHTTSGGVTITLTPPNQNTQMSITRGSPEYHEDLERRIIKIAIPEIAQEGQWTYSVHNTYPGFQSATMSVSSKQTGDEPIAITSELNKSTSDSDPIIAYAQLNKGNRPIVNASVNAFITRPEGGEDAFKLLDNGAGADITKNDGIYSRYVTSISHTGFYGFRVTAENTGAAKIVRRQVRSRAPAFINITDDGELVLPPSIGGYDVPIPGEDPFEYEDAPPFTRASFTGSTNVQSVPDSIVNGGDGFPPSRITDLRVTSTSVKNLSAVLTWTAPGDDLDSGAASRYDIRLSDDVQALGTEFENAFPVTQEDVIEGNLTNPLSFGSTERYTIAVDGLNTTSFSYAFAVRAEDDANQTGYVSNIVVASFIRVVPDEPVTTMMTTSPSSGASCIATLIALLVTTTTAIFIVYPD